MFKALSFISAPPPWLMQISSKRTGCLEDEKLVKLFGMLTVHFKKLQRCRFLLFFFFCGAPGKYSATIPCRDRGFD